MKQQHDAGFGCMGDSVEVQARVTGKGGKSWTSLDRKVEAEGQSLAYMGRLWFCGKVWECPTPETAIA
jgi:hypothetical protein